MAMPRRPRRPSLTAGLLGAVLVLVAAGCQTTQKWPPVPEGTGPPAPIIVLRSSILHSVLAQHGELADTFAGRMTYLVAPAAGPGQAGTLGGSLADSLAGTVRNTYIYKSYAAFASDLAAGRLPAAVHAVLYDIEKWPATPPGEQQHPQAFMRRFSALARAHGLLPILAPARDLALVPGGTCARRGSENLSQAYIRCGLAGADQGAAALVVQSQAEEFSVPAFRHFVAAVARQARAGNPRIAVLAQLATAPLGQPASVPQLVSAARSVHSLVDGFSLTARNVDTGTTAGLLWSFSRLGRP
jgi:hypothetical protein